MANFASGVDWSMYGRNAAVMQELASIKGDLEQIKKILGICPLPIKVFIDEDGIQRMVRPGEPGYEEDNRRNTKSASRGL